MDNCLICGETLQPHICMRSLSRQAVEGAVVLPENQDFSQIGVKKPKLHFITAGSKGSFLQ